MGSSLLYALRRRTNDDAVTTKVPPTKYKECHTTCPSSLFDLRHQQTKSMLSSMMGNLPKDSLLPAPPFFYTTLDYAVPISIQYNTRKRRRRADEDLQSTHYQK